MENRIHHLMIVAAGENWEINKAHISEVAGVIETIVIHGTESGEFNVEDPAREARNVIAAFTPFYHPILVEQAIRQGTDISSHLRDQIAFYIRALGGSATNDGKPIWREADAVTGGVPSGGLSCPMVKP